jgi:hypothetical protein
MADIEQAPNVLLDELRWVHNLLRHDLVTCLQLGADVAQGASADEVRTRIGEMQTTGGLFHLRRNCLRHCRFVHAHHGHEDILLFPAVREAAPSLGAVVDKLEADHRKISGLLDSLESAARNLDGDGEPTTRQHLVDLLEELSGDLLEHLAFEEESLAPVLRSWDRWPGFG